MTSFSELGLSKPVMNAVASLGYQEPTPVQQQAIPLVLQGRDIVAAAKTGTGKTAAFALPSMDGLPRAKGGKGPVMLVVTPTRELAAQIAEVCQVVAKHTNLRVFSVVGGVSYNPQIAQLRRGVDVLIATPGRLVDLMQQSAVNLADVRVLVLDEADRMLDMGFLPSVRKVVAATPQSRQTLLFSATIDDSVMGQVGNLLKEPQFVEIAHKGETADTVDQYLVRIPQLAKPALLKAVLEEKGGSRIIVFARTRHRADAVCRRLKKAGFSAEAIHSDRSQNQRQRALANFADGKTDVIVATDVLARGIDVDQVNYVVNYDLPHEPEDYVHRIGRTGRAGCTGWAVSFVSPENEIDLRAIQKLIGQQLPELPLPGFDRDGVVAEAEAKTAAREASKDPDIVAAKKEMAKKARRKNRAKARDEAEREARAEAAEKKSPAKLQLPRGPKKPKTTGGQKRERGASKAAAAGRKTKGVATAGRPDMRPGRAHRAAQAQARKRSR
ncbi:DEAD/DEAH box helicase [Parvibacter caecicola]|uniref:DEAD/DEAH box helicase n=1 Tax=Parvibacter caecicola TaxID=747645 RepID=UPI00248B39D2|nr:DEAD/DEAH box helicase [Parvibacter caecicola]